MPAFLKPAHFVLDYNFREKEQERKRKGEKKYLIPDRRKQPTYLKQQCAGFASYVFKVRSTKCLHTELSSVRNSFLYTTNIQTYLACAFALLRPRQLSHLAHWELFWRVFFVFNKFSLAFFLHDRRQFIAHVSMVSLALWFSIFLLRAGVRRSISAGHGQFTLKGLHLQLDRDKFHCLQRSSLTIAPVMHPNQGLETT